MQRDTCVVCGNPLETGYRGRPRVTCGTTCYNKRRTLRAHNREALDATQRPLLQVVQLLAVWPELQIRAIELLTAIRKQDDEVVSTSLATSIEQNDGVREAVERCEDADYDQWLRTQAR